MAPTAKASASGASTDPLNVSRGAQKHSSGQAGPKAAGAAAINGAAAPQADAGKQQQQIRSASASLQDVSSMTALAGLAADACGHTDARGNTALAETKHRSLQKRDPPTAEAVLQQPASKRQRTTAPAGPASPITSSKRAARAKPESSRPRPSSPPPQEVSNALAIPGPAWYAATPESEYM